MDSTRALAKRRCSETLATKVRLARSCQVAKEELAGPFLGLGTRRGHGALASYWVPAAHHVRRTPNKLLDCILAHMQHSISPGTAGQKTNMTMENPPFEDVFPTENMDFPASHVSFQGGN